MNCAKKHFNGSGLRNNWIIFGIKFIRMKKLLLLFAIILIGINCNAQNPTFLWTESIGGASDDIGKAITIDALGNIYSTGTFSGTADFDPSGGIYNLTATGSIDIFISKYNSNGSLVWAKKVGANNNDWVYSISNDRLGNVYVVGSFNGTGDFDPGSGTNQLTSAGNDDVFVLKLDPLGNFIFAKSIGGSSNDVAESIYVDQSNNVLIVGEYGGIVDFDSGIGTYSLTSVGNTDVFILKLDAAGNFIFAKSIGGNNFDYGTTIKLDNFGNVYISGSFGDTVDFNPNAGVYNLTTFGSADIFILKLDAIGNFIFAKQLGGSSYESCYSMDVDKNGNIYSTGILTGGVSDFNPGIGVFNLTSNGFGYDDIFLSKLDSYGNFVWAKSIGASLEENCRSIVLDTMGHIYITGQFEGTVDFNPNAGIFNITSIGNKDVFVSMLDTTGNFVWAKNMGGINSANCGNRIALDYSGNIYTIGIFSNTVDFDPQGSHYNLTANSPIGYSDAFIHKIFQCNAPNNPINNSNQNVCTGSSTTFSVSGQGLIRWYAALSSTVVLNTGATFVTPSLSAGTYTYYAEASTCTISPSRTSIVVTVDPNCQDVWPGDANSDGAADNLDILELGLHYTQTGAPRVSTSNSWQSYFANNWTGTITNGSNLNHSDCNGDGTIDDNDTLAIFNNYGLTHTFKAAETTTVNPQITIVPDQPMVAKGTWGTASVYLGDAVTNITNINGVAFTVDFDNTLIEPNSIYIEYQNSFIDAGQNLHFRKLDFANSKLFTASTHTLSNNVSGFGKIATLHYQILSSLATDQVLNIAISQANQSDASGAITPLTSGTGTLMAIGSSVGLKENNFSGNVSMSPNPTNALLTIASQLDFTKIELLSITGQVLLSETVNTKSYQLQLQNFAEGIYFVKASYANGLSNVKKVVKQ